MLPTDQKQQQQVQQGKQIESMMMGQKALSISISRSINQSVISLVINRAVMLC
jgi:hypothetical protein